jgi:hypothetical protein
LVRVLQNGSAEIAKTRQEARDLGIILGDEFAAEGAKYQDTMNRVSRISGALRTKLLFELAPAIEELTTKFVEWWKINGQFVTSRIVSFFGGVADVISVVAFVITNLVKDVLFLIDTLGGLTAIVLLVLIIDDLITAFRGGESAIVNFVTKARDIHTILGALAGGAVAVGAFGAAVLALAPVATIVTTLKNVFIALNLAILANPVVAIIALIVAAVAGLTYLVVKNWDVIADAGKKALGVVLGLFSSLGEIGSNVANAIGEKWSAIIGGIGQKWRKMVAFIQDLVPDFIKEGVAKVQGFFTDGSAKKVAGSVVTAAAIGSNVAAVSPQNISNSRSASNATTNHNQYQVDVKIQGDASGLTQEDVTRGVQKALEDVSVGGLRNTVTSYR